MAMLVWSSDPQPHALKKAHSRRIHSCCSIVSDQQVGIIIRTESGLFVVDKWNRGRRCLSFDALTGLLVRLATWSLLSPLGGSSGPAPVTALLAFQTCVQNRPRLLQLNRGRECDRLLCFQIGCERHVVVGGKQRIRGHTFFFFFLRVPHIKKKNFSQFCWLTHHKGINEM